MIFTQLRVIIIVNLVIGGEIEMNNVNDSIGCSVMQCQYHAQKQNNCTLSKINVGTHEVNPTEKKCTDCESFMLKK